MEVLFSGGIFKHNRLRTGAIWEVSWTNRRANDRERQERMNQVKETVYLFKFLFPKKMSFPCERQAPLLRKFFGGDPCRLNKKTVSQSYKNKKPNDMDKYNSPASPELNSPKIVPSQNIPPLKRNPKVPGLNLPRGNRNGIDKLEFRLSVERDISDEDDEGESYDDFDHEMPPMNVMTRNAQKVPNLNFGSGGLGGLGGGGIRTGRQGLALNLGKIHKFIFQILLQGTSRGILIASGMRISKGRRTESSILISETQLESKLSTSTSLISAQ